MIQKIKKISPVLLVGIILTILSVVFYVSGSGFIIAVSNYAYDAFLRKVHTDPKTDKVAIVDLDDDSLAKKGQWPWPRHRVAKLTENLFKAGAAVVAFDVVFAEKDRTSPASVQTDVKNSFGVEMKMEGLPANLADFDELFADIIRKYTNVVLGCEMVPSDQKTVNPDFSKLPRYEENRFIARFKPNAGGDSVSARKFFKQAETIVAPILKLSAEAHIAFFNADPDEDNIVRSNPLVWEYGNRIYPALSLEAIYLYGGSVGRIAVDYDGEGIQCVTVGKRKVATSESGRLVVNYRTVRDVRRGFSSSFPTFSAADVLDEKLDPKSVAGKIVFIGASAVGLKDVKATPLTESFSGVEVHATMVDNILSGDVLALPKEMILVNVLMMIGSGLFLTYLIYKARSWVSFSVAAAIVVLAVNVSVWLMKYANLVFVPVWLILAVLIIYPILTMIRFWQEELQKKKVRDMFGTMVSPNVLHYLESHPESFSLSGLKAEATMFFSDVAGFTKISESLKPEDLSALLNNYLSPMTDIIMARGGYVDKYEGDAIMAEWGVPYPTKDHAVQACLAALEQQKKLDELRPALKAESGFDIYVRMGINTGSVTAGNMGSNKRFQYTVMGDAVNQAARFEPVNKDYKTRIVIGESTYVEAKDHIEARLLDKIRVVGKIKPVNIYELIALKGAMPPQKAKVVAIYEEALRLHWERKWDESLERLVDALALDPEDGPCVRLCQIVADYKVKPPPEEWQGEYVRLTKD